MIVKERNQW